MIRFKDVQISYGKFVAVDNLNLEIKEGEFFTMLGPSGCGKTTTLRALLGFNEVTKGEIYINEKNVTKMPIEERGIGIVFQSYALFPTMTVYENIAFGLKVKKLNKDEVDKKVREICKKVHITEDKLFKNVSELSGGQQQRIAIARALVLNPAILCLDEPLSNLDAKLRVELRRELKRLQKQLKITTIYVTHDQEEALTLSDKIAVFNNGFVEQVGTPKEIYEKSKSKFVCEFIGDINKLQKTDLEKISPILSDKFNKDADIYFRLENLKTLRYDESDIEIEAIIDDVEYTGMTSKITYEVNGVKLKNVEKNSSDKDFKVGET
ncbi:ABC transporter ATP-binding protein, partial [Oceanivirga salmonicida]|uniref:ABC transporter ATP-binding protein n=1 Tax=Oceanivirga salmonicida TaxID=1769291 RepID=UPI000833A948